uniref:Uncharacterized protein n=1 Tax=Anguilla anguilla TaxID=7936 RepID=A0A0E9TSG9_ANGAN
MVGGHLSKGVSDKFKIRSLGSTQMKWHDHRI